MDDISFIFKTTTFTKFIKLFESLKKQSSLKYCALTRAYKCNHVYRLFVILDLFQIVWWSPKNNHKWYNASDT